MFTDLCTIIVIVVEPVVLSGGRGIKQTYPWDTNLSSCIINTVRRLWRVNLYLITEEIIPSLSTLKITYPGYPYGISCHTKFSVRDIHPVFTSFYLYGSPQ